MRKKKTPSIFMKYLEYYVNTYMPEARGLSKNTINSYKTTFTLLIKYIYSVKKMKADEITFDCLDVNTLSDFMSWLENERKCSVTTRNQRLAALYSFSAYAQNYDFDAASTFRSAVLRIPSKKAPKKRRVGFTTDEVKILLALPDQKSETGLRDMVLLSFMYATGTRAQEVCDLTVKSVNFRSTGTTIDIVGKGSKARRIRIPDPCASMLRKYIRHRRIETEPDRHIFSSQTHEHMTISCVEEIYKKYIKLAKEKTPNLFKEEHYSPHSMRHTTGQHMLEAGVPIMVIKSFLGHASVQTTQIYTESPQATVDKHIREWNEMNFPRSVYIDEKDLEERNVPDFLKSH